MREWLALPFYLAFALFFVIAVFIAYGRTAAWDDTKEALKALKQ